MNPLITPDILARMEFENDKRSLITSDESRLGDSVHVCILGAGGVGKTAITQRYLHDNFVQNWEATIEDAYRKKVWVDNEVVTLDITDTAGQEDFSSLRPQWMMGKDGYVFVYSLVDKESLEHLNSYIQLLEQVTVGLPYIPPVVFIGNKKDLVDQDPEARQVYKQDVDKILRSFLESSNRARYNNGIPPPKEDCEMCDVLHFEASAFNGERISDTFEFLIREYRRLKTQKTTAIDQKTCCVIM